MTLREELKPANEPVISRINHDLHNDIAKQVAEFINRGGKVQHIPAGVGIDNIARIEIRNEFDNSKPGEYAERRLKASRGAGSIKKGTQDPTPLAYCGVKNRAVAKNKSGHQNIHVMQSGRFNILIGSVRYGNYEKLEDALAFRDATRVKLGLPPADY